MTTLMTTFSSPCNLPRRLGSFGSAARRRHWLVAADAQGLSARLQRRRHGHEPLGGAALVHRDWD